MPKYATHLCLVSDQATPNLLPVLDPTWQPRKVVLARSKQMVDRAEALAKVLRPRCHGIEIAMRDLPDAYDYAALSDNFLDFLAGCEGEDVALNVTGGTKLMAVAAQEVFRSEGKPVFYVNVQTDEVIVIGQSARWQPLVSKLTVREMLEVHGHTVSPIRQIQVTAPQRDVTARLLDHLQSAAEAFGTLNYLAQLAEGKPGLTTQIDKKNSKWKALQALLFLLEDAQMLRLDGDKLTFADEEARRFVQGEWLEKHVYQTLQGLQGKYASISDVVTGVELEFDQRSRRTGKPLTRNEIDVACLYHNTLHLIECKTANYAKEPGDQDDKAATVLYKLESLQKLGGLRTKTMIVDLRGHLADQDANRNRAEESNILIVHGRELHDLRNVLERKWFSKGGEGKGTHA
ncbi:Card1-like endonuclease domain-containing protein [Candidatus Symbiobacter mobilis]|uniref:DUF1887 family protein n=1 Tax=Candidatus Symbiobacter mobilis CR TaxID=946483 RepID=U5N9T7_9BURK|nr:DUF1887 family CARF protein [Candidatus Symbiobacter mobilis]AGX86939.1 hypothetical protein Cenrod_0834 [Candidatus Symbiobacter mobilis CR]